MYRDINKRDINKLFLLCFTLISSIFITVFFKIDSNNKDRYYAEYKKYKISDINNIINADELSRLIEIKDNNYISNKSDLVTYNIKAANLTIEDLNKYQEESYKDIREEDMLLNIKEDKINKNINKDEIILPKRKINIMESVNKDINNKRYITVYSNEDNIYIGGLKNKYIGITRNDINYLESVTPKINKYQHTIIKDAVRYIGKPYLWGGTGPDKYDCSAFVREVYDHNGVRLPRVSIDQSGKGIIVNPREITTGDLLFFDTFRPADVANRKVTHVGMYIGRGKMIHASLDGIKIEDAFNDFFDDRFIVARRPYINK